MLKHNFINLHFNSEYSLLNSSISIDKAISFALEKNEEYLVVTEKNNFFSIAEFNEKCKKNNIKPLFGIELEIDIYKNYKSFNLIFIAKSFKALKHLFYLSSEKLNNKEIALENIETQDLIIIDHPSLGFLSKFGQEIDYPNIYVNSNDEHKKNGIYINEKVAFDDKGLKIINIFQKIKGEEKVNKKIFSCCGENEMIAKRTNQLAKSAYFELPSSISQFKIAKFNYNSSKSSYEILKEIIATKFKEEYQKIFEDTNFLEESKKRINFELSVIKKLNIADYFLIIYDIVNWSKNNDIAIGPGRGSASSSIISFILNITTINPLEHNLLFERFLNLERISMPDIDIDIQDDKRDLVIEYITQKYGKDKCSLITTFQKLSAKSALKDVARIYEIPFPVINEITKLIPNDFNLETAYQKKAAFKAKIKEDEALEKIFELAKEIENFPRQVGIHAAGIVISNEQLLNSIPVYWNDDSILVSQLSNKYLEKWGHLKIDLLGLRTLTIIKDIENKIIKEIDKNFSLKNINFNDEKTNKLLSKGDTIGIFQLESHGMINVLKKAKVSQFIDLVDIISLYRPGPIKNIDLYVENKNNLNKIEKIDSIYDEIVSPTKGIIIYQEQIMEIAQKFSGMSFSEADLLRKAISKKDEKLIFNLKEKFISKSIEKKHSEQTIHKIYNQIEKFAQYGFNKAHAVSYATISYQMAFLKTRFPKFFYESILSNSLSKEMLKKYIDEIKKYGLTVEGPSVNKTQENPYFLSQNLIMPISIIKGFGSVVTNKIIKEREQNGKFTSFIDFVVRAKNINISDNAIKILIESNALREFGNVNTLLNNYGFDEEKNENIITTISDYTNLIKVKQEDGSFYFDKEILKEPSIVHLEEDIDQESKLEFKYYGMVFSSFPTYKYETKTKLSNIKENIEYLLFVYVLNVKEITDKNGNKMGVVSIQDSSKIEDIYVFANFWTKLSTLQNYKNKIIKLKIIKKISSFNGKINYIIKDFGGVNE